MINNSLLDVASTKLANLVNNIFSMGNPYNKVTDLNKEANKFSIDLYGVYSQNIPSEVMTQVQKMVSAKYVSSVGQVLKLLMERVREDRESGKTKVNAQDIAVNMLGNQDDDVNSKIQSVSDRANFSEMVFSFNENSLSNAKPISEAISGGGRFDPVTAVKGETMDFTINALVPKLDKNGNIELDDKGKEIYDEEKIIFDFKVKINLVPVETSKLLDIIGTTKDRSLLFNYFSLRAGVSSLFKGFLLNLKEINKSVKRSVSGSLEDRILESMMKTGGYLTPRLFSDLDESRHYVMCLEKTDFDTLKVNYKFDLSKPNALRTLFDRYKILSLVIVDTISKTMIIHDSDRPLLGMVINYNSGVSNDEALNMFAKLSRI